MQHFQLKLIFISFDLIYIKFQDILGPDTEAGCIKRKIRLFFCRYTNAQTERHFGTALIGLQFFFIIEDGNHILETGVDQFGNAGSIVLLFVSVTDDIGFLIDLPALVQTVDDLDIIRIGCFEMDIVFQCFFYDKREVRTLGAITIKIFPFVFVLFKSIFKHLLRLVDLHTDLGQIGQFHRRTILVDQRFQVEAIEFEITIIILVKPFLWKMESLVNQRSVGIIHLRGSGLDSEHGFFSRYKNNSLFSLSAKKINPAFTSPRAG